MTEGPKKPFPKPGQPVGPGGPPAAKPAVRGLGSGAKAPSSESGSGSGSSSGTGSGSASPSGRLRSPGRLASSLASPATGSTASATSAASPPASPPSPGSSASTEEAPLVRRGGTGTSGAFKAVPKVGSGKRAHLRGSDADSGREHALRHSAAEPEFRRGMPLAVKIAAFAAVLVAILMTVIGIFLYGVAAEEVERQLDQKGVVAVTELASLVDPIFYYRPKDLPDLAWQGYKNERAREWREKLQRLVNGDGKDIFLNIHITEDEQGSRAAFMNPVTSALPAELVKLKQRGDVTIYEGTFRGDDFQGRVRRFVRPIDLAPPGDGDDDWDAGGRSGKPGASAARPTKRVGYAIVDVKAADLDKVRDSIRTRTLLVTLVGIGVAIVLSILISTFIARPVRALVQDMKMVSAGNLDHRTVPRSSDEIGVLASAFNHMTKSLKAAQQAESERKAIEHELQIATEIQTKLLPERIPQIPGLDIFSFYLSAKEVGGDYYDFPVIDPQHLGICVADVSGKGIPGSMVMTMVRSLLRLASHREASPAETLKKVNRILAKDIRRGMFVTCNYSVLDVTRRVLTVASAGHNPMVYFCARTGEVRQVNPSGIALGFDKGPTFDENIREERIELQSGDRVVIYTDGVVEAMSAASEEFGMDRFVALVRDHAPRSSKDFVNAIIEALEGHRGKAEQSDDITITTLKVE